MLDVAGKEYVAKEAEEGEEAKRVEGEDGCPTGSAEEGEGGEETQISST